MRHKEVEVSKLAGSNILIQFAMEENDDKESMESSATTSSRGVPLRPTKQKKARADSVATNSNPFKVKLLPVDLSAKKEVDAKEENVLMSWIFFLKMW